MKLHLPKSLLTALLATFSVAATLASTAWAGWNCDGGTGGYAFYYDGKDNEPETTVSTLTLPTSGVGPNSVTKGYKDLYMGAGYTGTEGQKSTFGKIIAEDGVNLTVTVNPWQNAKFYSSLVIEELEFGGGSGSGSFNVTNTFNGYTGTYATQTVRLNKVSGTLSSVINEGNLTLGSVNLNGTITNKNILNIAGTLVGSGAISNGEGGVVRIDTTGELTSFKGITYKDANGNASSTNVGFITGEQTFRILDGVTYDGTVYVNDSDTTATLTEDGYITVNVGDSKVFYVADTWDCNTDQLSGAASLYVTDAGTMNIVSDTDSSSILLATEGSGTIVLAANAQVSNAATVFTGDLIIGAGANSDNFKTLSVGGKWMEEKNLNNTASISSFSKVTLDKGEIVHNAVGSTIKNLTVTKNGGKFSVYDMTFSTPIRLAGTTILDGNLEINTYWKQKTIIEKISGSGHLEIMAGQNSGTNDEIYITINDFDAYSGNITVNSKDGSKGTTLQLGANIDITNSKCNLLSVTLNKGSKLVIDGHDNSKDSAQASQYIGKIEMGDNTTVNLNDGSYYLHQGVHLQAGASGTIENQWDKKQYLSALYGDADSEISLKRMNSTNSGWNSGYNTFALLEKGNFSGTIHLVNTEDAAAYNHGLTVTSGAAGALEKAVVDFGSGDTEYGSVLVFSDNVSSATAGSLLDGKVGGLTGTNGKIYAANLTVDVAESGDYTYEGDINAITFYKSGLGTQTLTKSISADVVVNGGVLNVSGGRAIAGSSISIENGVVNAYHSGEGTSVISNKTTVKIKTGGTLNLSGHDMLGWDSASAPEKIIMESNNAQNQAILNLNDTGAFSFVGQVEMKGNSIVEGTKASTLDATMKASNTNNVVTIEELQIRGDEDKEFKIDVEKDGELTIESKLVDYYAGASKITKSGEGKLILTHTESSWTNTLNVDEGILQLRENASISAATVVMNANTELQTKSGSCIGSLVLESGASLTMDVAITLNGYLKLGENITLGGNLLTAVKQLQAGDSLAIFNQVSDLVLNGTTEADVMTLSESALIEADASLYFTNLEAGLYYITFENNTVSILSNIPEPTTATLSLLALTALAARRRRQK